MTVLDRSAWERGVQRVARRLAGAVERDTWVIRSARPAYEAAMHWLTGGRGISWTINGESIRIDPRRRHRLGEQYDVPVAAFRRKRIARGSVCLDVGANVGVYVLQLARRAGPEGRLVAFEPNPGARAVLKRHVAWNGLVDRVDIVASAVGRADGEAMLHAAAADGMSRLAEVNPRLQGSTTAIEVPVVTLDASCRDVGIEPDWLLIDIEGFEIAALEGARELIRRRGRALTIVVEMHSNVWASAGTTRASTERLLDELALVARPRTGQRDALADHGQVWRDHS